MAFGERGEIAAQRIAMRVSGEERGKPIGHVVHRDHSRGGPGVIGIAFIQMLLIGVGFVVKGVPGPGCWPSSSSCWGLPRPRRRLSRCR
jgi:hypothetical protein